MTNGRVIVTLSKERPSYMAGAYNHDRAHRPITMGEIDQMIAKSARRKRERAKARARMTNPQIKASVRNHTYRNESGYLVQAFTRWSGDGRWRMSSSIFVKTRDAADHIRDKLKRGEEIEIPDYTYRSPT
jgi:hypothetical protein